MKKYYVYQLIDPRDNKIFYIGKGQNRRMYTHVVKVKRGSVPNNNTHLYYKIRQILHSNTEIKYNKVLITEHEQDAYNKEKEVIEKIGLKNLCNLSSGGLGGTNNKRKPHTDKTKRKMSLAHKGKTYNEIYGKNAQFEIEKRRASMKGRKFTKEHKEKLSKAMKGHPPTKGFSGRKHKLESRRKISEKMKDENNPRFLIYIISSPENNEFQFRGRKEVIAFFKQFNIDNELRGKEKISPHNLLKNKINKRWRIIKSIKK